MVQYLKNSIANLVLCTCMTLSLVQVVCSGFVLTDAWSGNAAAVLACSALLTLALVLLSYNRITVLAGVGSGAVLAVAALVYINVVRPFGDESANSAFIFALLQIITAVLVWLLTRSRPGTVVLFLAGSVLCAGAHFLEFPIPAWCLFLFLPAVCAAFLCRTYTVSLTSADMVSGSQGAYLGQTALVTVLALLLSCGIFFGLVRPLDPPTQELKLITVLKSMQQLELMGVSSTQIILDPDMASMEEPDQQETGNKKTDMESDSPEGTSDLPQPNLLDNMRDTFTSTVQQTWSAVRYDSHHFQWLWLLLLIPAAVAAAYLWHYQSRKRWRRQVQALPRESAVINYYHYFLKRLNRLGLKRAENATLREYAQVNQVQLQPFEGETCRFAELTDIAEWAL